MASNAWDTISPSAITERGAENAIRTVQQQFPSATEKMIMNAAAGSPLANAYTAAMPGLLSTYGPIAGVGLGAAYLGGAFKPIPATPPSNIDEFNTTGKDLLARDPSTYGLTYGGGSTTYAANPYNDMYSPGQVDTTKYQGDPYANIYSRAPSSYPTARFAEGGDVQGYARGGMFRLVSKRASLRAGAERAGLVGVPVPLQQRSLANLTGELAMIQNAPAGAKMAVPGGNFAAYTQQLRDAIAANTAQANSMASAPVTPSPSTPLARVNPISMINMNSPGRVAMARYAVDPYARQYSNSTASYPTARLAAGGIASLEDFPRKNGPIDGPGTGTSDSVPAMLSDGEFVFTARAVRAMGKGSRRKGAKRMYAIMKQLEAKGK
jgi:hypothetical protein